MKFVIQRVLDANVKVGGEVVGKIGRGLLVLVGLTHSDKQSDIDFAAKKLLNIRLWDDENCVRWKECVKSKNYEILLVSQFTLYSIFKGNKPDFHKALEPEPAEKLYNYFLEVLKKNYVPERIQAGKFGEYMEVSLINDGPVTINWEYPEFDEKEQKSDTKSNISEPIKKKQQQHKGKEKKEKNNENNCIGNFPITEKEIKDFNQLNIDESKNKHK